jgi:L-gulonolactone oxidase
LSLSAETEPELFRAARVSVGALGVITQVTLQCVPAYNLYLRAEPRPFDKVLGQIDRLNQENERVRLYWFPATDVIYVMTLNPTEAPVTRRLPVLQWFRDVAIRHDLLAVLIRAGKRLPDLVDGINQFSATVGFQEEHQVARSDQVLNIPMPPRHQEMEYAVPIERTAEAIRLSRRLIEENNYRASFPMEIRFVAADDDMLSPAGGRAVCYLGAYTYGEAFAGPYFAGFEQAMKGLTGRPHWGKRHSLTPAEARGMYPQFDRFSEIRRELDPAGTFANRYIRDLFA